MCRTGTTRPATIKGATRRQPLCISYSRPSHPERSGSPAPCVSPGTVSVMPSLPIRSLAKPRPATPLPQRPFENTHSPRDIPRPLSPPLSNNTCQASPRNSPPQNPLENARPPRDIPHPLSPPPLEHTLIKPRPAASPPQSFLPTTLSRSLALRKSAPSPRSHRRTDKHKQTSGCRRMHRHPVRKGRERQKQGEKTIG